MSESCNLVESTMKAIQDPPTIRVGCRVDASNYPFQAIRFAEDAGVQEETSVL
jgi:hypothetical protein